MKRFYIQANTPDGITNFIVRNDNVKNENHAIVHFTKKNSLTQSDIIHISDKRPPTNYENVSSSSIKQLSELVQQLIHSHNDEEVCNG